MDNGTKGKFDEYRLLIDVLDRVAAERARQRRLLAEGILADDCASPKTDPGVKLCVLAKEVGGVAQEIDWLRKMLRRPLGAPRNGRLAARQRRLQTECIQVAAVAVAMAESIEKELRA